MPTVRKRGHANVQQYRERMREQGFRQIQIWVPDTRSPKFAQECRRQSLLATQHETENDIIESVQTAARDTEGWQP